MEEVFRFSQDNIIRALKKISLEKAVFFLIVFLYAPLALGLRFCLLENALLEPHPWRQTQTALTVLQLFQGTARLWDYRSPLHGLLWNNVYEFPLYQWVVANVMHLGFGLEVASRTVTLFSFALTGVFGFLLTKEVFDLRTAKWFLLLFIVNPFGVVFSRVCLIDFFALASTLASVFGVIKLRNGDRAVLYWILFFVGGLVASLGKINIWFFITAAVLFIIVYEYVTQPSSRCRWQWGLLALLVGQLCCVLLWNYHRAYHLNSPADSPWLVGELKQRLEWWRWKKILWTFGVRSLFFDWLTVPFIVGSFYLFKKNKVLFFVLFGVFVLHTLVFFQVQTFHDYYLIASMPYLYAVVAFGMGKLLDATHKALRPLGLLVIGLLIFKAFNLRVYYSPLLHDYRPDLAPIYELKKFTDPEDVIFWDAKTGSFEIPTYSQRKVGLVETAKSIGTKNSYGEVYLPSALKFSSDLIQMGLLERFEQIWVDGSQDFKLYRTRAVGQFKFEPQRHIAGLSQSLSGSKVKTFQTEWNLCQSTDPVKVEIPRGNQQIRISSEKESLIAIFPGTLKVLSLPPQSELGCRFKLELG